MDTRKLRERFEIVQSLETNSFHPKIDKVRKKRPRGIEHPKYNSLWYMKREPKRVQPITEVIGQEFFRLLLPAQPKTRLMLQKDIYGQRDQLYILSKEISDYLSFDKINSVELKTNLLNGHYAGFGQVLVAALFLREDDLHLGNIGIDKNHCVVKIDGGHIFNSNRMTTPEDIAALPMLSQSYPINWLGINTWKEKLKRSVCQPDAMLASEEIRASSVFRREVNQMLLKICLLPDELLRKMAFSYGAQEAIAKGLTNLLLHSKCEIIAAAVLDADFKRYVVSAEAEEDLINYVSYLEQFKTTGKRYLLKDDEMDLGFINAMMEKFINMRAGMAAQSDISLLTQIGRWMGLIPQPEEESIAQRLRAHP